MICKDASRMLELRRQFAADKELSTPVVKSLMDAIDLMRWNHEEANDHCDCWQRARRAADGIVAA